MKTTEMRKAIEEKNYILILQTRRIHMLEEKMAELRSKYFQLKYADGVSPLKLIL